MNELVLVKGLVKIKLLSHYTEDPTFGSPNFSYGLRKKGEGIAESIISNECV